MLNHAPEILKMSQFNELEIGLLHLLIETGRESQKLETDAKLVYGKKAIRIARQLYIPDIAPEVNKQCKSIRESHKEFKEIMNHWY